MLLSSIRDEFVFHCQTRRLSPRTIKNYGEQIDTGIHLSELTDLTEEQIKYDYLLIRVKGSKSASSRNPLFSANETCPPTLSGVILNFPVIWFAADFCRIFSLLHFTAKYYIIGT